MTDRLKVKPQLRIVDGRNPWTDPQSYRDEIDYYENVARMRRKRVEADTRRDLRAAKRHYRWMAVRAWVSRIIDGDGFYLVTGALIATDLCLVIYLAGGGR